MCDQIDLKNIKNFQILTKPYFLTKSKLLEQKRYFSDDRL